ncbi:LCB1 [Candida pseudojiufengensis]|uniref:LCB1 n=1 Tax=Candida pseudojiufengensis TaxID=497109 RepID=UPI00222518B3|nr:LCB1 [Candida pseudojiufengensis]KAI5962639.1 LCB1 [Candida pseudojiufengensis]
MTYSSVFTTTTTTVTATTTTVVGNISSVETWDILINTLNLNILKLISLIQKIPGGNIIVRYIKSSYQNDPVRSIFEYALFLFALSYFFSAKRKENKSEIVRFSKNEITELCEEWNPEPLIAEVDALEVWQLKSIPEIKGQNGSHIKLNGFGDETIVNLASQDFLDLNENTDIKEAAKTEIKLAGVGACGPPNFYGTQDVHVRLEEDLAKYLGTEQAIIYGQDFVTAGSVIPAFLKRGDLCVVDRNINLALQKALIISRADIEWFDHNDMDHLEQILTQLKPVLAKQKPIRRRFIVTEGLFANTGDIANLPDIVELKNKFKYRLFLDESLSIAVVGPKGKGLCDHFNIDPLEVSITIGSMANSLASSGGFCVGVEPMIHHQRISSNAYVFSASLPPYSAKVASRAIRIIQNTDSSDGKSVIVSKLHKLTDFAYKSISSALVDSSMSITSSPHSPIIHLALNEAYRSRLNLPLLYGNSTFVTTGKPSKHLNSFDDFLNVESFMLQKIIDYVLVNSKILITRSKLILEHENLPLIPPHLLININCGVSEEEISRLVEVLPKAIEEVTRNINNEDEFFALTDEIINY